MYLSKEENEQKNSLEKTQKSELAHLKEEYIKYTNLYNELEDKRKSPGPGYRKYIKELQEKIESQE